MSVPSMFGLMSQSFYDIVDMIWIGRISVKAVAAVTIFVSIFWLFEVLNEIIGMSSVSLISQSYGSGNNERARRASEQTILFKFAIAVLAAVLMLLLVKANNKFLLSRSAGKIAGDGLWENQDIFPAAVLLFLQRKYHISVFRGCKNPYDSQTSERSGTNKLVTFPNDDKHGVLRKRNSQA